MGDHITALMVLMNRHLHHPLSIRSASHPTLAIRPLLVTRQVTPITRRIRTTPIRYKGYQMSLAPCFIMVVMATTLWTIPMTVLALSIAQALSLYTRGLAHITKRRLRTTASVAHQVLRQAALRTIQVAVHDMRIRLQSPVVLTVISTGYSVGCHTLFSGFASVPTELAQWSLDQ